MKNGMRLVQVAQYKKIIKKLNEIPFNTLFASAVLESKAHGSVFVDNIYQPKTFYIANFYGMSLLFGETENEAFNASLSDYMLNVVPHRVKPEWLQVYPEKWNDKLKQILNNRIIDYSALEDTHSKEDLDIFIEKSRKSHVIQWTRINLKYKELNINSDLPGKYSLSPIDSYIYDNIEGSVIPKYLWNSKEQFLADGIGYALMKGNDIVSIAFSSCIVGKFLEIGVETSKSYRGMGLGKYACLEMLNFCKNNNYVPVWACHKENIGSYKLAKSIGFEECAAIPYYELVSSN
jgi:RimJ/RimL family protein N-acetyltransferase